MSWQEVSNHWSKLMGSLAWMELRLVLAHFAYLFDAQLVPSTDPGYRYTVVIHPDPVYVILTSVSPSSPGKLGI